MPYFCIDYFATLGCRNEALIPVPPTVSMGDDDAKQVLDIRKVWDDAITDVAVITETEAVPDNTWEVVKRTLNGLDLLPPYVALRRRKDSHRMDHITEVRLVLEGAVIPKGFELITKSITGKHGAYLNPIGFLAIKRAPNTVLQLINGLKSFESLEIVLNSERPDLSEAYEIVTTVYRTGAAQSSTFPVSLAALYNPAVSLGNLVFQSFTIDRYPQQDQKGSELPTNELPMFGFPNGMKLHYGSMQSYPLPKFFTLVFTNLVGDPYYAECLRFYESIDRDSLHEAINRIYGYDTSLEGCQVYDKLAEGDGLFCPKVICVISRRPFYRAMRRILRQIYSLSLSSLPCPMEFYIASLVNQVPLPLPGGRSFNFVFDAGMISATSRSLAPITFTLPSSRFFPHMDLDFAGPLRCLSVENMLAIFTLVLKESKIVFICRSNTLLTETMETFRSLLFPLIWSSSFISPLPDALSGMLEKPGGFMVGFHVSEDLFTDTEESEISRRLAKGESLLQQQPWVQSLVTGTVIVDLSSNFLYQRNQQAIELLSPSAVSDIVKVLPLGPRRRLQTKLNKIAHEQQLGPQKNVQLHEFDGAFDFQMGGADESVIPFPTLEVRDIFMVFMIDLLGDYTKYIRPPSRDMKSDNFRTFQEGFGVDEYLAAADLSMKPIAQLLIETQMFSYLVQQRSEGSCDSLVFYEKIASFFRDLDLSAGGHGVKIPSLTSYPIPEIPLPMHKLYTIHELYEHRYGSWSSDNQVISNGVISKTNSPVPAQSPSVSPYSSINFTQRLSVGTYNQRSLQQLRRDYIHILVEFYNSSKEKICRMYGWPDESNEYQIIDTLYPRDELDKGFDIDLLNPMLGPLVIPGPLEKYKSVYGSTVKRHTGEIGAVTDHDGRFTYRHHWPNLDETFLMHSREAIHERLRNIRSASIFVQDKTSKLLVEIVRTTTERMVTDHSLPFDYQPTHPWETSKGPHSPKFEVDQLHSILVDLSSLSMSLLAARAIHQLKPTHDVLQMLGIFSQLEGLGLLPYIDECIWRTILIACYAYRGDSVDEMKHIACVTYDSLTEYHSKPDALTYGRLSQVLGMKGKTKASMGDSDAFESEISDQLDQYHFLEEMGASWFFDHRISVILSLVEMNQTQRKSLTSSSSSFSYSSSYNAMNNSTRTSALTGRFSVANPLGSRSSNDMNSSPYNTKQTAPRRSMKVETASIVADQLQLEKCTCYHISLYRPQFYLTTAVSRHITELIQYQTEKISPSFVISLMKDIRARHNETCSDIVSNRDNGSSSLSNSRLTSTDKSSPMVSHASFDATSNNNDRYSKSPVSSTAAFGKMLTGGLKMGIDGTTSLISAVAPGNTSTTQSPLNNKNDASKSPAGQSWLSTSWLTRTKSDVSASSSPSPLETKPSNLRTDLKHLPIQETNSSAARLDTIDSQDFSDDEESSDSTENYDEPVTLFPNDSTNDMISTDISLSAINLSNEFNDDNTKDGSNSDNHLAESTETDNRNSNSVRPSSSNKTTISTENIAKTIAAIIDHPEISAAETKKSLNVSELTGSYSYHKDNIQRGLYDALLSDLCQNKERNRQAVGIHCQTTCLSCGFTLLDEEVLAAWFGHSSVPMTPGSSSHTRRRSIKSYNHLSCSMCFQVIVPKLHMNCYAFNESNHDESNDPSLSENARKVSVIWSEDMEYLSPHGLRIAVEDTILRIGESICNPRIMHQYFPEVFWNVLWYTTRSFLPPGFLPLSFVSNLSSNESMERDIFWCEVDDRRKERYMERLSISPQHNHMHWIYQPIIVGWRENIVRAQVAILLSNETNRSKSLTDKIDQKMTIEPITYEDISIDDLFPGCTAEELQKLVAIADNMSDVSWTGMRESILDLSQLFRKNSSLMTNFRGGCKSFARNVYLGLLHLAIITKKEKLLQPLPSSSQSSSRMHGIKFDKCFIDTIRAILSEEDFKLIGESAETLVSAVPTEAARAFSLTLTLIV